MAKTLTVKVVGAEYPMAVDDGFEIPPTDGGGWFFFKGKTQQLAVHGHQVVAITLRPDSE